ncbi:recombinase family protein [Undibacterium parvum]|uniref:Recombinase family protein n=1 Tax=Undibacterium parvum TaxID=401471 RepID=A0A3S9HL84_9BURK|nr:recombinase family protein [Undibacterium parvum]AZP12877.1 recombinase family protein [Undibacterium parvum]
MRIFAYNRISKKDSNLDKQNAEIEQAGFKVDYWFKDEGISEKTSASKRPQFNALLAQIRDGETMVVSKLDRLGRDAIDVALTIKTLAARKIQVIVLQLGKLDITSKAGKLMLTMLSAVAELETDARLKRSPAEVLTVKAQGKIQKRSSALSEQQKQQVIERLNLGESVKEVSRFFGVPRINIMRINATL